MTELEKAIMNTINALFLEYNKLIAEKENLEKLVEEVKRLKTENRSLKNKVEELEAELRRPERMTASESMGYWGIYG